MKIKILALLVAGSVVSSSFGQAVILKNIGNAGGLGATSDGRVFVDGVLFDGDVNNVGVTVLGGPNAGSLTAMGLGTYTQANDPKGYTGNGLGSFELGTVGLGVNVPGVAAGGTATIQLQMWFNGPGASLFSSYAEAAAAPNGKVGIITFTNPTSNPGGAPPSVAGKLTGMPSINLVTAVPEPATVALVGLGAAALLAFRRRK